MARTKLVICPYCGEAQPAGERCRACRGVFEPLSRQATHNAMGPWYVRDGDRPFQPGISYETLIRFIEGGRINKISILRGPTTRQFWTIARRAPGVAHLLRYCHACDGRVEADDMACPQCGAEFGAYLDRNWLGLPDVDPLPDEAPIVEHIVGYRPAGSTLSSFAADHELLDDSGEAPAPAPTNAPDSVAMAEPGESFSDTDVLSSPLFRAMQRRVERQTSALRIVTAALILLVIGAVIALVLLIMADDRAAPRETAAPATPPGVTIDGSDPLERVGPTPAEVIPTESVMEEPEVPDPPPDETPPLPESSSYVDDQYAKALALAEHAADETRDREARIQDYEHALQILKTLRDTKPAEQLPADLDERIVTCTKAMELLKVETFFEG